MARGPHTCQVSMRSATTKKSTCRRLLRHPGMGSLPKNKRTNEARAKTKKRQPQQPKHHSHRHKKLTHTHTPEQKRKRKLLFSGPKNSGGLTLREKEGKLNRKMVCLVPVNLELTLWLRWPVLLTRSSFAGNCLLVYGLVFY